MSDKIVSLIEQEAKVRKQLAAELEASAGLAEAVQRAETEMEADKAKIEPHLAFAERLKDPKTDKIQVVGDSRKLPAGYPHRGRLQAQRDKAMRYKARRLLKVKVQVDRARESLDTNTKAINSLQEQLQKIEAEMGPKGAVS